MASQSRGSYSNRAGVLTIVAASILIAFTVFYFSNFLLNFIAIGYPLNASFVIYYFPGYVVLFAIGIVGLVGGVMSIKRRSYVLAVIGVSFVFIESIHRVLNAVGSFLFSAAVDPFTYYSNYLAVNITVFWADVIALILSLAALAYIIRALGPSLNSPNSGAH